MQCAIVTEPTEKVMKNYFPHQILSKFLMHTSIPPYLSTVFICALYSLYSYSVQSQLVGSDLFFASQWPILIFLEIE